jgi:hypothetical protein
MQAAALSLRCCSIDDERENSKKIIKIRKTQCDVFKYRYLVFIAVREVDIRSSALG